MLERFTVNLIDTMVTQKMISEDQKEDYEYAFLTLAERVITGASLLVVSLVMGTLVPMWLFLIFFLSLRKRTGGYHLNRFWMCYIGTIAISIGVIYIDPLLTENTYLMYGLLIVAMLVIFVIGTVNHPNVHMDCYELSESKKASRLLVVLECSVIAFFGFMGINKAYIGYMSMGVILCALLMCIAKITRQEVRADED